MSYEIAETIGNAFIELWLDMIGIVPEMIAALMILIVGIVIASVSGTITERVMRAIGVDAIATKFKVYELLRKAELKFTFSHLFGLVVKWFFIIAFLNIAAEIVGWIQITQFLNEVLRYIPNVFVAVAILALGLIVAEFVHELVRKVLATMNTPVRSPDLLAQVAHWAIVVFAVMAAVSQLGIAPQLIQILFASIMLTLAISFGLAGKEKAKQFLDSF